MLPFTLYRATTKFYANNEDARNNMDEDAKLASLTAVAYVHETPTRWSSGLECAISVLLNKAHSLTRAKRGNPKVPTPEALSDAAVVEGVHICTVLEPVRMATKLLEADAQGNQGRGQSNSHSNAHQNAAHKQPPSVEQYKGHWIKHQQPAHEGPV